MSKLPLAAVAVLSMAAVPIHPSSAATPGNQISITVVDLADAKKAVDSIVWVTETPSKVSTRIGRTDANGHVKQSYECKLGSTLFAIPQDKGTYFNSPEVDCGPMVTLLVPRKKTPRGEAVEIFYKTYSSPDLSSVDQYVWISRATISGQVKNIGSPVIIGGPKLNSTRCEVTIEPFVYTDIYNATTGEKVGQFPKAVLTGDISAPSQMMFSPVETHTFNKPCNETLIDLGKLKAGAAATTMQSVGNLIQSSPLNAVADPELKALLAKFRGTSG